MIKSILVSVVTIFSAQSMAMDFMPSVDFETMNNAIIQSIVDSASVKKAIKGDVKKITSTGFNTYDVESAECFVEVKVNMSLTKLAWVVRPVSPAVCAD